MGFGFSSMPNAAQRFGQAQTPNADLLAAQAQQESMSKQGAPTPPPQQGMGPNSGAGVSLSMPQHMPPIQSYNPPPIQMPSAAAGIPTPTPWTAGGVNLPAKFADAASSALGAPAEAASGSPQWMSMLAGVLGL